MTNTMDYQFPQQLFPSFYNCGPPDAVLRHCGAGDWGCYDRVVPQGSSGPLSSWTFTSRHQARGETWRHTEPVPVPLMSPKSTVLWPSKPPDPLDFTEHIQNFFLDHCQDAFGCMGEILSENFEQVQRERYGKESVYNVRSALDMMKFKMCPLSYSSKSLDVYSALLSDVVPAVPTELLGSLLHEELTEQRDRALFSEGATGGALAFVPFSQSGSDPQRGCLLYPGNQGLDRLNFHRVELQHHRGGSSSVDASSSDPFSFQLNGPIRQISSTSMFNDCCVAVRSDRLCGVWRFSEQNKPRLLQVVNTGEVATCVSVSPHVLGEVLVASESGAANLWSVGRGMQKVREEDANLYFNAKSSWRWCEFSAHPRVMVYADRTGVELTDIRESPVSSHTLFSISNTPECRSGERLILSRYLGHVHTFQHIVTTQYSAYIMDERFPCMPMLKWDHMMKSPPMFCLAVCGSASSGSTVGGARTTKVLLGSHNSQEITLLQYSGGRAEASSSQGPPQALLRPRDSLKHLPVQIPHRLDLATSRLSSPAAGLTCIQKRGGREAGGDECICILQLTEAGDIFYQTLEPEQPDTSRPPAAEDQPPPQPALKETTTSGGKTAQQLRPPHPKLVVSDTSSDEDVIGPTQGPNVPRFVAETPERDVYSDSSSEDLEPRGRSRLPKHLRLEVIVNEDPEMDGVSGPDAGVKDGEGCRDNPEEPGDVEVTGGGGSSSSGRAGPAERPVQLSDGVLVTWKRWLQKLVQKSRKKKPRPRRPQHLTVKTKDLQLPVNEAKDPTEEERVQSLRNDLRACMSKGSLLVHGAVSAPLQAPALVTVPDEVDTEVWMDEISQRLTVSWQGEGAWRAWWDEQLGLNREEKVTALRRKRRREKEAKRATGRRLDLVGSFASSLSYQSGLSDFSDSMGWSSAASQGAPSDNEGYLSHLEGFLESGTPRATTPTTPSATQTHTPAATLTTTPQSVRYTQGDQQTPGSTIALSQTPKHESTLANQRRRKRPAEDYLRSLFASQDEPSQHDSYFPDGESTTHHPPPPVAPNSSQRSLRTDLSQEAHLWSGLSQSLPFSQSSQGRPGPSQLKMKKKSRMGF
ncbi:TATA box-binding protein-associated factor, RNA polymerase I, subunit C [Anoplopoma fimbria]|uniref:TATA box-binding protein-associated factor, RNA polymerase I, subunit C n=1 Tax=Anoplopoma fimbria TaxID=229290 RepID=UPI0023EDF3C6|nr:TATA box-binding protein-associated factor, RNA polymerase I, subunit C [Anoplopoma fimbria]